VGETLTLALIVGNFEGGGVGKYLEVEELALDEAEDEAGLAGPHVTEEHPLRVHVVAASCCCSAVATTNE